MASLWWPPARFRGVSCKCKSVAEQTLHLLQWPKLSRAVSSFAATSLARERLQVITLPSTKRASELLLSETRAALEFEALRGDACDIGFIKSETVRAGLDRINKGAAFSGEEAVALASMLESARSLRNAAFSCTQENKEKEELLQPLLTMLSSIEVDMDSIKIIRSTVHDDGTIKDSASPELRKARMELQSAEQKLQQLLQRIIIEKLSDDSNAQVLNIGDRFCLTLSSENFQKAPGLLLQSSFGGTVSYVEPFAAVALNNTLSQAKAEVTQAEFQVLYNLTAKLLPFIDIFSSVLDTIVDFDVVLARGRYSSTLGAVRPEFSSEEARSEGTNSVEFVVRLEGARHPLLVEQHRERLRDAKSLLAAKRKAANRLKSRPYQSGADINDAEKDIRELEMQVAALETSSPVPIDFLVKKRTKVVTITGPNTGGKTAAVKTLGLAVLMARAGLYVLAKEPARLPWVDSVLADIGDQQSLSESLSTFSGHLQRIKQIQAETTSESLVLLDEVGTGTDFVEGAALGMAMLESFAEGGSLLTLATTHHGELKMLKYSDDRFENASVEFDEENLKPTYRLLWGIPGRSNAINIAARLGLPEEIIREARTLHGAANAELSELIMHLAEARQSFERDFVESQRLLGETKKYHEALSKATAEMKVHLATLSVDRADQMAVAEALARSKLNKMKTTSEKL